MRSLTISVTGFGVDVFESYLASLTRNIEEDPRPSECETMFRHQLLHRRNNAARVKPTFLQARTGLRSGQTQARFRA